MAEVQSIFNYQENKFLNQWTLHASANLLKESQLTSEEKKPLTKEDLKDGVFWVFTMKGTAQEINAIIAKYRTIQHADGFGERILFAEDNSRKHRYSRDEYLNEQDNKPADSNRP